MKKLEMNNRVLLTVFWLVLMGAACVSAETKQRTDKPFVVFKGQAQLFLDDELVASKENVVRVWHKLRKHPNNPLIQKSGLEDYTFLFGNVLREPEPNEGGGPIFRMWYFAAGNYVDGKGQSWVAYATSKDGLKWEKPKLGLYDIGGSNQNNAVWMLNGYRIAGLEGVIKDPNPRVPDDERYKMVFMGIKDEKNDRAKQYAMVVSPDGIIWKLHGIYNPIFAKNFL